MAMTDEVMHEINRLRDNTAARHLQILDKLLTTTYPGGLERRELLEESATLHANTQALIDQLIIECTEF